jgi:hypothetical protein
LILAMTQQLSLFPVDEVLPDEVLSKTCIACGCDKVIKDFPILRRGRGERDTMRSVCKECHKVACSVVTSYRDKNPIPKDFCCPLCNRNMEDFQKEGRYRTQSPFSVDHNPVTLEIRGWICNPCNSSMGLAKHSVDVLKNMIDYLRA